MNDNVWFLIALLGIGFGSVWLMTRGARQSKGRSSTTVASGDGGSGGVVGDDAYQRAAYGDASSSHGAHDHQGGPHSGDGGGHHGGDAGSHGGGFDGGGSHGGGDGGGGGGGDGGGGH